MTSKLWVLNGAMLVMAMTAGGSMTTQLAAQSTASPTFNKDVAPIIFSKCVRCHRPNQVAPMPLMSYKDVRPWARAIKDKTSKREMPPWFADPRFGEFRNDPRLSNEQIQTLAAWADAGAPQGNTPLMAELPKINDGWTHPSGREPDLVIEMADAYEGPAEGEVPWFNIYQELPAELKKDEHFIEAIQILPGVLSATHHVAFGIKPLPPGTKIGTGEAWPGGQIIKGALLDEATGKLASIVTRSEGVVRTGVAPRAEGEGVARGPNEFYYCCYVPGSTFRQYRDGGYQRIPKDGIIEWGMHYTMMGKPFADRQRVGLWFQKDPKHEIVGGSGTGRNTLVQGSEVVDSSYTPRRTSGASATGPSTPVIPPNTADWAITAITAYPDDVTLYTVWPHMHIRGHEMTYVLTYPDGREQILFSNLRYNYNWQLFYELKEPIKIPAGSTIKTVGSYDNSVRNKWNTQPQKEVYWSEQAWDEMYNGFRDVSLDKNDLVVTKTPATKPSTGGGGQ